MINYSMVLKSCGQRDLVGGMTDCRWLSLCLFCMVAVATAVSSGRTGKAYPVLKILDFSVKALGQEHK